MTPDQKQVKGERQRLLRTINHVTEIPMIVLSILWVALFTIDLTQGLPPLLATIQTIVWVIFIADFGLKIWLAPYRLEYLRENWISAISLLVPAVRMLRLVRVVRVFRLVSSARALNLVRFLGSINRGIRAAGRLLAERGIGYMVMITLIVMFAGAAGMLQFEQSSSLKDAGFRTGESGTPAIRDYGDALFWTAMTLTTMGSDYFPRTPEGRILGWLLALYAFSIFGFITATVASYFVGQRAVSEKQQVKKTADLQIEELRRLGEEIAALRRDLQEMRQPPG